MSKHSSDVVLRQMRDHALEAVRFLDGPSLDEYSENRLLILGITRLLEIVGESATRVDPAVQRQMTGIPWKSLFGMRNRLALGHDSVDKKIVWNVVKNDLPAIIETLDQHLEEPEFSAGQSA